ncbi:type II toxin-antitoxin system VapC family toxin [Polyangium sp. 6x1]|uniref:type II toxin-antitoxin system VapC family toxin n=1 Tax=Polyangium sp. 6x1 TaxID=3042689 RepID=UPI002482EC7D|nr:type II toxin-antitoxin system VapC family toxin [Polyangium sp. 6x1]MDI1450457.1 type II toxin-antitoxin system VapC family toxin [Polyangium sp. 6x1]
MSVRLVLDSSVLIAAMKEGDPGHADAVDFLDRLRAAHAAGQAEVFAPPELWIEVRAAAQKLRRVVVAPHGRGMDELLATLGVELVPITSVEEIDAFFERLARHLRDRAPFTNATDLVYLWVAFRRAAALVTLDAGLIKYHGMVCDVMRPFHVRLD